MTWSRSWLMSSTVTPWSRSDRMRRLDCRGLADTQSRRRLVHDDERLAPVTARAMAIDWR